MKPWLAFAVWLVLSGAVLATCPTPVRVVSPSYSYPVVQQVVTEVVPVAVFQPLIVNVPSYSAGYYPPPVAPAPVAPRPGFLDRLAAG